MAIDDGSQLSGSLKFDYDTLLQLIEHLRACVDVCTSRTVNWQKFCLWNEQVLAFFFKISFLLDEGVSPIVLQLLQGAICPPVQPQANATAPPRHTKSMSPFKSKSVTPKKSRSEEPEGGCGVGVADEDTFENASEVTCVALVRQINKHVDSTLFMKFVERFLLECNSTSVRWQAHSLVVTMHRYKIVRVDFLKNLF